MNIVEYKRIVKELSYITPFILELMARKKNYETQIRKYKNEDRNR